MKRYFRILGYFCAALAVFLLVVDTETVSFLAGRGQTVTGAALFLGALGVVLLGVSNRR